MQPGPGPLALVGSGEYLAVMAGVEGALIEGRPRRYVQIPTAAAPEGPDRLGYWLDLGAAQAERLGVQQVPVVVRDRDEAGSEDLAALIAGAGLVYLSGGNPQFLARTLRGTRVWAAVEAAWRSGAALAGCSAGAIALTDWVPAVRTPARAPEPGLGVLPWLRVLPHFDRMRSWAPDLATRAAAGRARAARPASDSGFLTFWASSRATRPHWIWARWRWSAKIRALARIGVLARMAVPASRSRPARI